MVDVRRLSGGLGSLSVVLFNCVIYQIKREVREILQSISIGLSLLCDTRVPGSSLFHDLDPAVS